MTDGSAAPEFPGIYGRFGSGTEDQQPASPAGTSLSGISLLADSAKAER